MKNISLHMWLKTILARAWEIFRYHPDWACATVAGLIYLFTISYRITDFPIYFFADEASQAISAGQLLVNHWIAANTQNIPIYVEAASNRWTPLVSMYIHAVTLMIFGKSIAVTRLTSALIGMGGALAASLSLKHIFKVNTWWSGMLFMLAMPAWFLHTRTAFETVTAAAFYSLFLLFYLLYLTRSANYLFGAVVFGALVFYSYSNAQAILLAAAGLLFISDLRYHWEHRKVVLMAIGLILIVALPFIIFQTREPGALTAHLRAVNSYLIKDIPVTQKIVTYLQNYIYGFSPQYWAVANHSDLIRHRMEGFAHIPIWSYGLMLIGLGIALQRRGTSAYRALLIFALATPAGAATLDISITRVLPFVVPASLLAALGLDWVFSKLTQFISEQAGRIGTLILLSISGLGLLFIALSQGPYWTKDYGLYGVQFGAKQIFVDTVPFYLLSDSENRIYISSTWANGAENFISYFIKTQDQPRVQMFGTDAYLKKVTPIGSKDYFIMTASEYQSLVESGVFEEIRVDKIIAYPDNSPGFYVTQLNYKNNAEELIIAQRNLLGETDQGQTLIDGQPANIIHSRVNTGQLADMFDEDFFTLVRSAEANPFMIDIAFQSERPISKFIGDFGAMDFAIIFVLFPTHGNSVRYEVTQTDVTTDAHVEFTFDRGPSPVKRIVINIIDLNAAGEANIHIRELKFVP